MINYLFSTVIGIGSNGMCNPYVSIRLVPDVDGSRFHLRGLKKVKTSVKHRTLFPLWVLYKFLFSNTTYQGSHWIPIFWQKYSQIEKKAMYFLSQSIKKNKVQVFFSNTYIPGFSLNLMFCNECNFQNNGINVQWCWIPFWNELDFFHWVQFL